MRTVLALALTALIATPAAAEWWKPNFDKDTVHNNPVVALTDLYIQNTEGNGFIKVTDILKQPPHVGFDKGPALQLPQQVKVNSLPARLRSFAVYDLNNDTVFDRSELTEGLLAWIITSEQGKPFGKVNFFVGSQPIDRFVMNYDDTAYLRRSVVQHGRTGSLELLDVIAK